MTNNMEARNEIVAKFAAAKVAIGARKRRGQKVRTDGCKSPMLAPNEEAVFMIGEQFKMIFSPAGARMPGTVDRILFYGREGVLAHEEAATREDFNALISA